MTAAAVAKWALRVLWGDKDNRYCLIAAALTVALFLSEKRVGKLREALAAPPAVRVQEVIRRVAGPVRIVERIVEKPGGERVIERVVQRDAVVTETDREKSVTPAARPRPRWYVGAGWIAGAVAREAWAARIGVSNGRLDVGYRYGRQGNSHGVEVALRF